MAKTRAQLNRAIRQEELREQLEKQGHLQHITDLLAKIGDLDEKLEKDKLDRLKVVLDAKFKLVAKYIPDLKSTEFTGEGGGPIVVETLTPAEAKKIAEELEEKV